MTSLFAFGAVVQWFEAYEATKQHNRVIVGGFSQRGVAGGGHNAIAPNYMVSVRETDQIRPTRIHSRFAGVDNALEVMIVTSDGSLPAHTATRICFRPFEVEVEAPEALSPRSLTKHSSLPPLPSTPYPLENFTNVNPTQNLLRKRLLRFVLRWGIISTDRFAPSSLVCIRPIYATMLLFVDP